MKKIVLSGIISIIMLDSTNYLKIEEDGQHIDDKYVDPLDKKINSDTLKKGELIIKSLYWIEFESGCYRIMFKKFNYVVYSLKIKDKMDKYLDTKNSFFSYIYFDNVKVKIIDIFSKRMNVDID